MRFVSMAADDKLAKKIAELQKKKAALQNFIDETLDEEDED